MKRFENALATIVVLGAALTTAHSAAALAPAKLGAQAPGLAVSEWVKGEPVEQVGDGTSVCLIEFWATWCGPCRQTMPHLTQLQEAYADAGLVVVGVTSEDPSVVRPFVERQGDAMGYRIAVDANNATTAAYLRPLGGRGIPFAVLVDREGFVVWSGHPMQGLDDILPRVLDPDYDRQADLRAAEAEQLLPRYFSMAGNEANAKAVKELGRRIVDDGEARPMVLGRFAYGILTEGALAVRDIELAREAAKRAVARTDAAQPQLLEVYAKALFDSGDAAGAVAQQKKAVELSGDSWRAGNAKRVLRTYEDALEKQDPAAP